MEDRIGVLVYKIDKTDDIRDRANDNMAAMETM